MTFICQSRMEGFDYDAKFPPFGVAKARSEGGNNIDRNKEAGKVVIKRSFNRVVKPYIPPKLYKNYDFFVKNFLFWRVKILFLHET